MARDRMILGLAAVALIAACSAKSDAGEEKPKPALPTQIEAVTFGQKSADPGERLFGRECAFCHVGRNTGTIMLQKRLPEDTPAQLHQRTDLSADYVTAVARNGLINMPAFSRAELSDAELAQIAAYLAKDKSK